MSEKWIKDFRTALKLRVGKGWSVIDSRGIVRLQVGTKPNVVSLSTHYKWNTYRLYKIKIKFLINPHLRNNHLRQLKLQNLSNVILEVFFR